MKASTIIDTRPIQESLSLKFDIPFASCQRFLPKTRPAIGIGAHLSWRWDEKRETMSEVFKESVAITQFCCEQKQFVVDNLKGMALGQEIAEARQDQVDEINHLLLPHKRYRIQIRKTVLDRLLEFYSKLEGDEIGIDEFKALVATTMHRLKVVNDYEKSERDEKNMVSRMKRRHFGPPDLKATARVEGRFRL